MKKIVLVLLLTLILSASVLAVCPNYCANEYDLRIGHWEPYLHTCVYYTFHCTTGCYNGHCVLFKYPFWQAMQMKLISN